MLSTWFLELLLPPLTHSSQPHPALQQGNRGRIHSCLKACQLQQHFPLPQGSRTMRNSYICKSFKNTKKIDDCSKHNLFLWMEKNRRKLKQREGEAACNFQHVTSATFEWLPRLKCKGNTPGLLTIRQTWQSSPLDQHSFLCLLSAVELSALHQ